MRDKLARHWAAVDKATSRMALGKGLRGPIGNAAELNMLAALTMVLWSRRAVARYVRSSVP